MHFEFDIKGMDALMKRVKDSFDGIKREVNKELYMFGEEVMTASKLLVPVDTGTLMNSGKVTLPEEIGNEVVVRVGYGDAASEYALFVHEALEGPYPIDPNWSWAKAAARGKTIAWSRPGSGPKYLERPLHERQDKLPGRISAAARRGLDAA